jgi:UDP-N-acetylglucosamine--N-acetylmuramyl-(pentapeptide) pyrophosphoryl-undecaprenol N-acetylglucosamine transferase
MGKGIKVLISAGGSGGHLLPAQQLGEKLLVSNECSKILFAAKKLNEAPSFQREKFPFCEIDSGSMSGKKMVFSLWAIMKGFFQSLRLINSFGPDVVVGFGSYHTFPVLLAAKVLGKPIVLFGADTTLGKVNRFFARGAKAIAMQFPQKGYKNVVQVPFLPWKSFSKQDSNSARKELCLNPNYFTLLVFGGSQGASFINSALFKVVEILQNRGAKFQVIHLTGSDQAQGELQYFYESRNIPAYVRKFEKNMALLYSAADLVISRSGASTIAELLNFEIPAILIPFPYASEGHQQKNADFFAKEVGGAIHLPELRINSEFLAKNILEILLDGGEKISQMKENIRSYKKKDKVIKKQDIADLIIKIGSL